MNLTKTTMTLSAGQPLAERRLKKRKGGVMSKCQHCGDDGKSIQLNGHRFCKSCGRIKRGPSTDRIKITDYAHKNWTQQIDADLAGVRGFWGEMADCLV